MTERAWERLKTGGIVWLPSVRWFTPAFFLAIGITSKLTELIMLHHKIDERELVRFVEI